MQQRNVAKWLLFISFVMVAAGCAPARLEKADATLRAYERSIRWSDFKTAFALSGKTTEPPDFNRLQHIRVTSYDLVGAPRANEDSSKFVQVVEIRYVNVNNMSERVLNDQQVWSYSESDDRWKLESPFPPFQ